MQINKFLFFCLMAFLSIQALASEQNKVQWIVEKFEPYYILDGKLKGQGAADRLVALLQKDVPEMQHATEFMPILRIRDALKAKEQIVSIAFLKDPTLAEHVQYSAATMLVPALEMTLRRTDWEQKWNSARSISANELLQRGGVIGVADGRHYGERLDALLTAKKHASNTVYVRAGNHYRGLAEMVYTRNLDATVGYSAELRYAQKLHPELSGLVSVPVSESMRPLYAYAILPKSEWGDRFRKRLNQSILKLRGTPEYMQAMTDWFGESRAWDVEYRKRLLSGQMDAQSAGM